MPHPQFIPASVWGLISLYFSFTFIFALFSLPTTLAAEISWETLFQPKKGAQIIALTFAAGLTTVQLKHIVNAYLHQEAAPELPPKPNPDALEFDDFLVELFTSDYVLQPKEIEESLYACVKRNSSKEGWIIADKTLPRTQTQALLRGLSVASERFFAALRFSQENLSAYEIEKTNHNITKDLLTNANTDLSRVDFQKEMGPFLELLGDKVNELERRDPDSVASLFRKELENVRAQIGNVIGKQVPTNITSFYDTLAWVRRQVVTLSKAPATSSPMEVDSQSTMTLADTWNAIPSSIRGNTPQPNTPEDMTTFLNRLIIPRRDHGQASCDHPRDLALELGDSPDQGWNVSLARVGNLLLGIPASVINTTGYKLFKAAEIPILKNISDYWDWRGSFQRIVKHKRIAQQDIDEGIELILSRFEGTASGPARLAPTDEIVQETWAETMEAFLAYFDRRFISPTLLRDRTIAFKRVRPGNSSTGVDFLTTFETEWLKLNEVRIASGGSPMNNEDAMTQLLSVLPEEIRNKLYEHKKYPELEEPRELYDLISRMWHSKHQTTSKAPSRSVNSSAASTADSNSFGSCNIPCWGTSPAIKQELRGVSRINGKIRNDLKNLCTKCRRPKSDHNGVPRGCTQQGNHDRHNTSSSAKQTPESGKVEEIE